MTVFYDSYLIVNLLRVRDGLFLGEGASSPQTSEYGADLTEVNVAILVPVEMVCYLLQLYLTHG